MENYLKFYIILRVIIIFAFLIFASSPVKAATIYNVNRVSGLKVGSTIADEQDNCLTKNNPKQKDVDGDGIGDVCDSCDDRDFDQDKIKNCLDKCPDKSENYNQYQDDDGCPDEKPKESLSPSEDKTATTKEEKKLLAVNITASPTSPDPEDKITFTATADDPAGVEEISIFINGQTKKICAQKCSSLEKPFGICSLLKGNTCLLILDPQPAGRITYLAKAVNSTGKTSETSKKELNIIEITMKPPEAVGIDVLYRVSGEIENFDYDYSRLKIGVCQAEKKCFLSFFGKSSLFCQEICSSDGFIKYADVSREGERLNYSIMLPGGNYILKPIFQPVGNCRWQSWDPKEQFIVVKDSGMEGMNFRYVPLGTQNPKVDILILGIQRRAGSPGSIYTNEEKKRLADKIQEYQSALADEGLCSYSGYLDTEETRDITGVAEFPLWYTSFNIRGAIRQILGRLNSSYLLLVGGNDLFGGISTDDFYGDLDGDNLLDIPVGRIPDPDNGDVEVLINYFETAAQLHKNGGLDLSNHQGLMMGGSWTESRCLYKELFGRECSMSLYCKNSLFDCTLTEANNKGFFLLLLHGSDYPQKFSTNYSSEQGINKCLGWGEGKGFLPTDISSLNIRNSLWLALPCYGGLIEDRATSQESVPMMFLKNGGAVYIGDNDLSYGSKGCPREAMNCKDCLDSSCNTCSEELPAGDSCSGALYLEVAKRFSPGIRIGDAFLQGKNYYYANYDCAWEGRDYIYHIAHLYGDPTLKIKRKW